MFYIIDCTYSLVTQATVFVDNMGANSIELDLTSVNLLFEIIVESRSVFRHIADNATRIFRNPSGRRSSLADGWNVLDDPTLPPHRPHFDVTRVEQFNRDASGDTELSGVVFE